MRLKNRNRYFVQWDKGQIIIVDECPPDTFVHFSNTKSDKAYVLQTDANHEVLVPDILLQEALPLTAWVYVIEDGIHYTEARREFQVIKRPKPEDYIYTEDDKYFWESKVDKDWGLENAGKFLVIGADGIVTASDIYDPTKADKYFAFVQNVASDEWIIDHYLDKNPSVTVVDSGGTVIIGTVNYLNQSRLQINFSAPFSGTAYLN